MTREEFAKGMLILQGGIGRQFDRTTMEVWFRVLGDFDAEDFGYAIDRYLAEADSAFPMPAKLRAYVEERRNGVMPDHGEAFNSVMQAVRKFGSYQPAKALASLDSVTQAAVRACGGFQWFCDMESDQRQTMAAQFRMAYQLAQERTIRERRLPEALRPNVAHQRLITKSSSADTVDSADGLRVFDEQIQGGEQVLSNSDEQQSDLINWHFRRQKEKAAAVDRGSSSAQSEHNTRVEGMANHGRKKPPQSG